MSNKKILYIVGNENFFISHRLDIALEAKKKGYEIHLATNKSNLKKFFKSKGIFTHQISEKNTKSKLILFFLNFINTIKIIKKISPDIVQVITIFNILSSGLALIFTNQKNIIFSVSGLGYLFTNSSIFTKLLKSLVISILSIVFILKKPIVIFQNNEDLKDLDKYKILKRQNIIFIKGSGVDIKKYNEKIKKSLTKNVLFASRLLVHKGIVEFINAAELVKKKHKKINFVVAGEIDSTNPSFIDKNLIEKYKKKKIIKYVGYYKNIKKLFKKSSILVLPSYREGTPKVIIEALSYGLPVIASNISGCKTVIKNNYNGILVPIKNSKVLANKIVKLLFDKKLRSSFVKNGKLTAKKELDINLVIDKHLKIYKRLIYS